MFAQAHLERPQRRRLVLADVETPIGFAQAQHEFGLFDRQRRAQALQRLGETVAARLQRGVPDQRREQRMGDLGGLEHFARDRVGEFGDQILQHRRGLARDAQGGRHRHRRLRQPRSLPLTAEQPPPDPPLPVGAPQFGHDPPGPHPPFDRPRHVPEVAQIAGDRLPRQPLAQDHRRLIGGGSVRSHPLAAVAAEDFRAMPELRGPQQRTERVGHGLRGLAVDPQQQARPRGPQTVQHGSHPNRRHRQPRPRPARISASRWIGWDIRWS